jgi:SNF2 family DNA or RNA helicase
MVGKTWVSKISSFTHMLAVRLSGFTYSGLLARMKWYRVVLDEAQFIRNRCVNQVLYLATEPNLVLQGDSGQ